jgi:hypothetical protein
MTIEKFEVRNRWTNAVQFTAEIEVTPEMTTHIKLGLVVKWGKANGADLRGANLSDADLRGADLRGANLRDADLYGANLSGADLRDANLYDANLYGANLSGANLRDADLYGANLRSFKADFFMTLLHAQSEVPYLIAALKEGRVDGSQYEGECACLVGTLANGSGKQYNEAFPDCSSNNPAECWFMMIRKGDKAGDDSGGGFAAQKALEWAEEFQALMAAQS